MVWTKEAREHMSELKKEWWSTLSLEERQRIKKGLDLSPKRHTDTPSLRTCRERARRIMKDEPKVCYFCDATPVDSPKKRWHVHHIDGNPFNNERKNLSWSHLKCHKRHHGKSLVALMKNMSSVERAEHGRKVHEGHLKRQLTAPLVS